MDWQRLLDLVRSQGWRSEWGAGEAPVDATELFAEEDRPTVKVWPIESLQVNVFLLQEQSIDFDFDSRQLAGEGLDACFAFLRTVGRALEKPVLLKQRASMPGRSQGMTLKSTTSSPRSASPDSAGQRVRAAGAPR